MPARRGEIKLWVFKSHYLNDVVTMQGGSCKDPPDKGKPDIFGWDSTTGTRLPEGYAFDVEHMGWLHLDQLKKAHPDIPSSVIRKLRTLAITVIVTHSDTEVETYPFAAKTAWIRANAGDIKFYETASNKGTMPLKTALQYFFKKEDDGVLKIRWTTVEWQQEWRRFINDMVEKMRRGDVFIGFNAQSDLNYIEKSMPDMHECGDAQFLSHCPGEGWGPESYNPKSFVKRMTKHTFCVQKALKDAFQACGTSFASGEQSLGFWCKCNKIGSKHDEITGAEAIELACKQDWKTLATYCAQDAELHFKLFMRATDLHGVVHPKFDGGKRSVTVTCHLIESIENKYAAYVEYVKQKELNDNSRAAGGAAAVDNVQRPVKRACIDLTGED